MNLRGAAERRRAGSKMPPDLEYILKWIIMSIILTVAAEILKQPMLS